MNCGITLFIYDRPQCTERVLESLKRNHVKELYVFQDGCGEKTNRAGWEQNKKLIMEIDWCEVYYECNPQKMWGLDEQIIYGINKVFDQKEEIIVIEDDCIISDDCIEFMKKCLKTYQFNAKVLEIGAYLEPVKIPTDYSMPVIATGIPSGQVWGTWKKCWEEFQRDYAIIKRIGNSMKNYKIFDSFGYPVKKILADYWLLGTWDLWWSIYVLVKEGISVRPIRNKVYNIGFENPGTHTSGESPWVVPISDEAGSKEIFPEEIEVEPWAETEFKKFYQRVYGRSSSGERQAYYRKCLEKWVELRQQGKSISEVLSKKEIKSIAIYGMGSIGKLLVDELIEENRIKYFIVTNKNSDNFMGYPVYDCDGELPPESIDLSLIVIPGYDIQEIKKLVGEKFYGIYSLGDIFN